MAGYLHVYRGDFGEYTLDEVPPKHRRTRRGPDMRFKIGRLIAKYEAELRAGEAIAFLKMSKYRPPAFSKWVAING